VEIQRIRGTMTMIASYWDGGWVLLDVDDPASRPHPRLRLRGKDTPSRLSRARQRPQAGRVHRRGRQQLLGRRAPPAARAKGQGKRQAAPANELILASDRDSGLWIFRYTGGK
jgi:hypothetical protein